MAILLNIFLVFFFLSASWAESGCVACHQGLQDPRQAKVFQAWKTSVHGEIEESCQTCHGGDASASVKEKAHKGVRGKDDPRSPIRRNNIPSTCGKCHEDILQDFTKSAHYKKIANNEKAPDCVTCHSPKSGFIVSVETMESLCLPCHGKSGPAHPAPMERARKLYAFYSSELKERREKTAGRIEDERKKGVPLELAEKLQALSGKYTLQAKAAWHAFQLEEFELKIRKAYFLAEEAENLLNKKQ